MPKFFISVNEEYPFYDLSRDAPEWRSEYFIDLTEEEFRDYESMSINYEKWRSKIGKRTDEVHNQLRKSRLTRGESNG